VRRRGLTGDRPIGGPGGEWSRRDQVLAGLREENRNLTRAVEELTLLNDIAQVISTCMSTAQAIELIVHRATRALGAEQGVLTLVDPRSEDPSMTLVRAMESDASSRTIHLPSRVMSWVLEHHEPFLSNAPALDRRLEGVRLDEQVRSILCTPMLVGGEAQGVLTVWNKRWGGGFTPDDERLLVILAMQSAQFLENARLREGESALRNIREEIQIASRIQRELLPKEPPSVPGYTVSGITLAAQVVSGDYFDFVRLDPQKTAICLGDVCGKGLSSSLLMANLQAIIRTQALYEPPGADCHDHCLHRFREPARQCLVRSNRLLWRCTPPERFVTLFYGILDEKEHSLRFSNAGHNPPFLWHAGQVERLKTGGLPLAVQEDSAYEERLVALEPGDTLLMYSDGVTEAEDAGGEPFGEERLKHLLGENAEAGPEILSRKVLEGVRRHLGDAAQSDDMTLVVVRRQEA